MNIVPHISTRGGHNSYHPKLQGSIASDIFVTSPACNGAWWRCRPKQRAEGPGWWCLQGSRLPGNWLWNVLRGFDDKNGKKNEERLHWARAGFVTFCIFGYFLSGKVMFCDRRLFAAHCVNWSWRCWRPRKGHIVPILPTPTLPKAGTLGRTRILLNSFYLELHCSCVSISNIYAQLNLWI